MPSPNLSTLSSLPLFAIPGIVTRNFDLLFYSDGPQENVKKKKKSLYFWQTVTSRASVIALFNEPLHGHPRADASFGPGMPSSLLINS